MTGKVAMGITNHKRTRYFLSFSYFYNLQLRLLLVCLPFQPCLTSLFRLTTSNQALNPTTTKEVKKRVDEISFHVSIFICQGKDSCYPTRRDQKIKLFFSLPLYKTFQRLILSSCILASQTLDNVNVHPTPASHQQTFLPSFLGAWEFEGLGDMHV